MTVALAVALPCAAALWLLTTAASPVPSTYAFFAVLVASLAVVAMKTWNGGQPTGSMAQVIHTADVAPAGKPAARDTGQTSASRWNAWQSRGEELAETGRARALLAFGLALTGALLLYAWIV
jgi:hypothetical protein